MSRPLLVAAGIALLILHHDWWFWDSTHLLLGFLPIGMAYHIAYSVAASAFWACVVIWAWPRRIDALEPESANASTPPTAS